MQTHDYRAGHCDASGNPVFVFDFDPQSLRIEHTPFGLLIDLPQGRPDGTPGGPALPIVVVEAVLPAGTRVGYVKVELGKSVALSREGPVAPLQPAAPGAHYCTGFDRLRNDGLVSALAKPAFVPPDIALYKRAVEQGKRSVELVAHDDAGLQAIAKIVLRPVVLDDHGAVLLHTSIRVTLLLEPAPRDDDDSKRVRFGSHAQAERWTELVRSRVINPHALLDIGSIIGRLFGQADYLVITDNQRWDAAAMRPIGAAGGDLVAEFERLVAWKRAKGLSAKVVTISDIMSGAYGTFAGACRRDLQEVLREFVKFAHANWGTAWLLLGGDIDIVPVRTVAGFVGGFSPTATDPPELGGAFWTGSFLKIRADGVGSDWELASSVTGARIPFDATGSSSATRAGWFYADASYTMRSTMATGQIRVNGPAADLNGELFWLNGDNTIPTDLYYADVAGYPARAANGHWVRLGGGRLERMVRICDPHDWDSIGNRLYGQWNGSGSIDGVRYNPDVSVGRAPAGNGNEAKTFVDKVIAYERGSGGVFSLAWLGKLLMVSSNWGGRSGFGPANPLVDNSYIKRPADDHAVIQLAAAPSSFNYKLISVVTDADQRELPFRLDASAAQRGWRFARSATDPSASTLTIPMPWGFLWELPIPSRWIVAYATAQEMSPASFTLDEAASDGSMLDQEALRTQLAADVPAWSSVRRLYEDEIDLPQPVSGPPVEHLTGARLQTRLNEGQHIVSLSGHGYWGGCCGLEPSMRTSLSNGGRTFIAYADSCLTNQFDVDDAISESLLQCETGGAVAYVGNTRFSWIGVGDDFQRNFFRGLPWTRALGLLNDRRVSMLGANTGFWGVYNHWSVFSLNLTGDPEMRLWTHPPRRLCIDVPDRIHINRTLTVRAQLDGRAAAQVVVTLRQDGLTRQQRSDANGQVHFDLQGMKPAALLLTAVHEQAAALQLTLELLGPSWLDVKVKAVRALVEGTTALVSTAQGERELTVPKGASDLLALLAQAAASDEPLRLKLDPDGGIEGAEWGSTPNGQ